LISYLVQDSKGLVLLLFVLLGKAGINPFGSMRFTLMYIKQKFGPVCCRVLC